MVRGVVGTRHRGRATPTSFAPKWSSNATGPFTDAVRRMEDPGAKPMVKPSQGVHIVLDKSFSPGRLGHHGAPHRRRPRHVSPSPGMVGWWWARPTPPIDAPVTRTPARFPRRTEFLLVHAARYLTKDPKPEDVLSVFTGIRPLVVFGRRGKHIGPFARPHAPHLPAGPCDDHRRQVDNLPAHGRGYRQPSLASRGIGDAPVHHHAPAHSRLPRGSGAFWRPPLLRKQTQFPIEELIRGESRYAARLHPRLPVQGRPGGMGRAARDGAHGRGFSFRAAFGLCCWTRASVWRWPQLSPRLMAEELRPRQGLGRRAGGGVHATRQRLYRLIHACAAACPMSASAAAVGKTPRRDPPRGARHGRHNPTWAPDCFDFTQRLSDAVEGFGDRSHLPDQQLVAQCE